MGKIVVIGSSNIDMIMKMDHLPTPGETVTNADFLQVNGGKGANQAVAAARSGGDVSFINCVGDDPMAKPMVDSFKLEGIHTEYIFRETGIATGTALIMIDKKGENSISVAPGANYRLTPGYIDTVTETIRKANYLLLQYEILPETLAYSIEKANRLGVKTVLNFAPARELDRKYLAMLDILVVNEIEAEFLSAIRPDSEDSKARAAQALLDLGVKTVILTLGSRGSYIRTREEAIEVEAFKVEPVDTTAAGDTYCGCLVTALDEGKSLEQAVRFASAGAAISVTRLGAQPSAPTRKEIETFLNTRNE